MFVTKECTDQFVGWCWTLHRMPATPLQWKHVLAHFSEILGLFIGVLQRTRGLINSNFASCCLICWEIFSLAFGSFFTRFLWLLLYVQIIKKKNKKIKWNRVILNLWSSFLLESCTLTDPVTCAVTQLQYLNVSRSAASAGVTQLPRAHAWAAGV